MQHDGWIFFLSFSERVQTRCPTTFGARASALPHGAHIPPNKSFFGSASKRAQPRCPTLEICRQGLSEDVAGGRRYPQLVEPSDNPAEQAMRRALDREGDALIWEARRRSGFI